MSSFAWSHDVDIVQEVLSSSEQLALSLEVRVKSAALNGRMWAFKVSQTVGVALHFCCSCGLSLVLSVDGDDGPYLS